MLAGDRRGRSPSARRPGGGRTRSRGSAGWRSPSPAPVSSASAASSRRQLEGCRPDWADLAHRAARRRGSRRTRPPRETLNSGRGRTRTQASVITPRIPSEPISIRSGRGPGARARQPPALPGPARGDRPHRLDQVVDVGLQRREVPAGPGRDPAAEGRVLEGLREVAQGEPVLAQLLLEAAARSPRPGSAPPASSGRPRAPGRAGAGPSSPPAARRAARSTPPTTLVPPPKGITAAPSASAQLSTVSISDSSRGNATRSGGFSNSPRNPRTTSR